jgi:purine-binding chemotaxis protein CheW
MRADPTSWADESDPVDADVLEDDPSFTFLTFDLDGQTVGISVAAVREILDLQPVTRLPNAPMHVEGVIDVRGASVPVFDLSPTLGLSAGPPGADSRLIVFERDGGRPFAVMADRVREVARIDPAAVEPPPAFENAVDPDLLLGLCRRDGALVVLIAADRLFDDGRGRFA